MTRSYGGCIIDHMTTDAEILARIAAARQRFAAGTTDGLWPDDSPVADEDMASWLTL